jgi:hypothetical protein
MYSLPALNPHAAPGLEDPVPAQNRVSKRAERFGQLLRVRSIPEYLTKTFGHPDRQEGAAYLPL